MKSTEEVQAYMDKEYPDMHLEVRRHRGQEMVFDIFGHVGFTCNLDEVENLSHIKERLLESLGHAKGLIEHDIARILGE